MIIRVSGVILRCMEPINICSRCQTNVSSLDYFCPNCGRKLKEKPLSTSVLKQVLIYSLSLLLPPLGIWPAIKYLQQPDQKSKNVGIVSLVLTIISIVVTIYLCVGLLNSVSAQLNNQLQMYQDFRF